MSASNWFIGVGLFTVAIAGGALAYRTQTAPPVVMPAPKVELSCPAVGAPVVNVEVPASKAVDTTTGKPPLEIAHVARKKPKPKPKPGAAAKLKSKWVAPDPFKLGDLFNGKP